MYQKLKHIVEDDLFFYTTLIVLVGAVSFGLGRYSVPSVSKSGLQPNISLQQVANVQSSSSEEGTQKLLVGSKNGTKYHLLTCGGASQIKEENKVFFSSKEEALSKGYSPAANCKGI